MNNPIARRKPNNVLVCAVAFMAGTISIGSFFPMKPFTALTGFGRLKKVSKSHGDNGVAKIRAMIQTYETINIRANSMIAFFLPTRMANVLRPFSVSSSISRILFDKRMAPTRIAIGTDTMMAVEVTSPAWIKKEIKMISMPMKNPATISPKGVRAIGYGPPVYKYPTSMLTSPTAASHQDEEAQI